MLDAETQTAFTEMWNDGVKAPELARRFGVTTKTARAMAKRFGLVVIPGPPLWTKEKTEKLIELYPTHTTQAICEILGISRGAVCGKVDRLGIGKPRAERPPKVRAPRTIKIKGPPKFKCEPLPEEKPLHLTPLKITLLDLKDGQCRWPIGTPHGADTKFCGHPWVGGGYSYCAGHHRMAYRGRGKGGLERLAKAFD